MTTQIDLATAAQIFEKKVTVKYQNSMKLEGSVTERHGVIGDATNVPVSGQIEMSSGSFAPTNIPITPLDETNNIIVPQDYRVKTAIGGGQKTLFAYDKIDTHSVIHGLAGARLEDWVRINAILTSPGYGSMYTVAVDVGVNTGINQGKISDALSYLEDQGVDVTNFNITMYAMAVLKKSMMADEKIVSIFYNDKKPLTNNMIQTYSDVDCRFLGSNGVNTLPFTTNGDIDQYLIPMVAKDALVQTYNRDLQTSITWVPQEDRYELLSTITTGALVIQTNGIALITANNTFVNN